MQREANMPQIRACHAMFLSVAACVILALAPVSTFAGINSWTSTGPDSAVVYDMAIDPVDPLVVWAATSTVVYKTVDGGESWVSVSGIYGPFFASSVAIDPVQTSTVYVAASGGVFKTTDGGVSWNQVNIGITNTSIYPIAIAPSSSSTIYCATDWNGTAFRSLNGGASWTEINAGLPSVRFVNLAVDPSNPSIVYGGTMDNGVFRWDGTSWSQFSDGMSETYVQQLEYGCSGTLFATAGNGFYRKQGDSWTLLASFGAAWLEAIAVDPSTENIIYGGNYQGIFRSGDAGVTWALISSLEASCEIRDIVIDPVNTANLYAGTYGRAVFKSTDSAVSWAKMSSGLRNAEIVSMAMEPSNPAVVYAAEENSGIYKTVDGGSSWIALTNGLGGINTFVLAMDPAAPSTIYAATWQGVYKTTDSGANWAEKINGIPILSTTCIAVDPIDHLKIYTGVEGWGVYASSDGGENWSAATSGITNKKMCRIAAGAGVLYAAAEFSGEVFRSLDGGANWTSVLDDIGWTVFSVVVDQTDASRVYVCSPYGLYISADSGDSWTCVHPSAGSSEVHAIAIDPVTPSTLYASTYYGLFVSADHGQTWDLFSGGDWTSKKITEILPSSTDPINMHTGVSPSGIWSYTGCTAFSLSPDTLPQCSFGFPYSASLAAAGGTGPYTYTIISGALPDGITLGEDGSFSGSPLQSGTFIFTARAYDINMCYADKEYSIYVCPEIAVAPQSLVGGCSGTPLSIQLSATGATGAWTIAVTSGSLPPGTNLSSDGLLSGTPSSGGSYVFTVTVTDEGGCSGTRDYSLEIGAAPSSPLITSIVDLSWTSFGLQIFFNPGAPAERHDLYRDGALVATGFVSGGTYNGLNNLSHSYSILAVNGSCSTMSGAVPAVDNGSRLVPRTRIPLEPIPFP